MNNRKLSAFLQVLGGVAGTALVWIFGFVVSGYFASFDVTTTSTRVAPLSFLFPLLLAGFGLLCGLLAGKRGWKPLFVTVCVMFVLPLLCYLLCLFTVSALENILPQVLYAAILIGCGYGILPLSSGAMGFAQCLEDWFGWKSYDGSLEFAFLLYILCIGAAILGGWILYRRTQAEATHSDTIADRANL